MKSGGNEMKLGRRVKIVGGKVNIGCTGKIVGKTNHFINEIVYLIHLDETLEKYKTIPGWWVKHSDLELINK